jgi:hypothetical protein
MNTLHVNHNNPHCYNPLPIPSIIQQLSVHFIMPPSYTDAIYFDTIHLLAFSNFPIIVESFSAQIVTLKI